IKPEEVLVVHDELDFPPGVARVKQGGGIAGHNGLKDISQRLATHEYWRLRLGVGKPPAGREGADYVLEKPPAEEKAAIDATIEPNVGIVEVPDLRLDVIAELAQPQKLVPAVVEFVDIAGLVAGASKGEGLGNKFLANIRETDAIAHVVRCFEDPNVVHVAGKVNPVSDIETINTELALADLDAVERQLAKNEKVAQSGGDKEAQ